MGVWGPGNFANDEALDYAHSLTDHMIAQIKQTVASPTLMEPDEPASTHMLCNIDFLLLIAQHAGLSLLAADLVEQWKERYLAVWDGYIDRLDPKPSFKEKRRAVIVASFDRLAAFCRSQQR